MIKELKYMNINYSLKDLEYIDYLCEKIELECDKILNFFEIKKLNEKVKIKLYDDLKKLQMLYKETYNMEPENWLCGFALDNNVYTLSLSEYKKTSSHEDAIVDDLIRLILHEFTHSIHSKRHSNMVIKWLTEGAATYLSGQNEDAKEITANLFQIINGGCSYSNYRAMFAYVYETYGKEYMLKLIDDEKLLLEETERLYLETIEFYNNNLTNKKYCV